MKSILILMVLLISSSLYATEYDYPTVRASVTSCERSSSVGVPNYLKEYSVALRQPSEPSMADERASQYYAAKQYYTQQRAFTRCLQNEINLHEK